MLLNTGDDIFSGVLSMFDIRLIGENIDPRKVPELTLRSSYDPERQGIAALAYPSRFGGDISFINFAVSFALSARLQVVPKSIDEWRDDCPGRPSEEYKRYWDIWRAFNVNRASRVSPFRAERIARVRHPEGRVSLYVGEGRVLAVIGLVNVIRLEERREDVEAQCRELAAAMARAGLKPGLADSLVEELRVHVNPAGAAAAFNTVESASREGGAVEAQVDRRVIPDVLEILDPAALGLSEAGDWRVQDLVQHGYVECESIGRIPVTLVGSRPQVLLIEPRRRAPGLAHFTGIDAARVVVKGGTMTVSVEGVEGAPLDLYVDAGGRTVRCDEPGFAVEPLATGLVRVSGFVNASRTVNLKIN
jgi:hypothetical protein